MQNIATKFDNISVLSAEEFNNVQQDIENSVTATDQTLDGSNAFQMHRAMVNMSMFGDFMVDSGAADAYVLSPLAAITPADPPNGPNNTLGPSLLKDGLKVRFVVGNTNAGASTVIVDSLGVMDLKKNGGVDPLTGGELPAGQVVEIVFVDAQNAFTVYSVESTGLGGVTSVLGETGDVDWQPLSNKASPVGTDIFGVTESGGGNVSVTWQTMLDNFTGAPASEFPAGTRMLFQQTLTPPSWTKEVAAVFNNAGIRNTTGAVGTGGSVNYDSVHVAARSLAIANTTAGGSVTINNNTLGGSTAGFTLTTAEIPLHRHMTGVAAEPSDNIAIFGLATNPGGTGGTSNNVSSGNAGVATSPWSNGGNETGTTTPLGGGSHSHSLAGQGDHGHPGSSFSGNVHTHTGSVNLNVKRFDTVIGIKT